jgi:hypothetical protein
MDLNKMHELRNSFRNMKVRKLEKEHKIRKLTEQVQTKKVRDMAGLKQRRLDLLNDKDLRARHNITNQKDWKVKIDTQLTKDAESTIERKYVETDDIITALREDMDFIRIKLSDMEWELRIELAFVEAGYVISKQPAINKETEQIRA